MRQGSWVGNADRLSCFFNRYVLSEGIIWHLNLLLLLRINLEDLLRRGVSGKHLLFFMCINIDLKVLLRRSVSGKHLVFRFLDHLCLNKILIVLLVCDSLHQ